MRVSRPKIARAKIIQKDGSAGRPAADPTPWWGAPPGYFGRTAARRPLPGMA